MHHRFRLCRGVIRALVSVAARPNTNHKVNWNGGAWSRGKLEFRLGTDGCETRRLCPNAAFV